MLSFPQFQLFQYPCSLRCPQLVAISHTCQDPLPGGGSASKLGLN